MKKTAIISGLVFISLLFISQGLFSQGYLRGDPGIEENYCLYNLTQEQMGKIDKLDLELEKELLPLFSKIRSIYMELEELEAQRNPDITKIEKIWETIFKYENDIQNKELLYDKKIRDLLTEEQKASIDSFSAYGRGGFGRGNIGRGYERYGVGLGQNYMGRGAGRLGRGFYGNGNAVNRGYGRNLGYLGQGTGRISYGNVRGVRYGRGRWNWDKK